MTSKEDWTDCEEEDETCWASEQNDHNEVNIQIFRHTDGDYYFWSREERRDSKTLACLAKMKRRRTNMMGGCGGPSGTNRAHKSVLSFKYYYSTYNRFILSDSFLSSSWKVFICLRSLEEKPIKTLISNVYVFNLQVFFLVNIIEILGMINVIQGSIISKREVII